jgi:hypothetical protein
MSSETISDNRSPKILIGRDAIIKYIGMGDKRQYYELVKLGLPVIKVSGTLYAHADNIENWFQSISSEQNLGD